MRFRTALSLTALFVVCFTVVSWATPIPEPILAPRSAADAQLQSGKIASASDPDFSLHVTRGEQRKTIEFLIDGNSKVGRQATSRLAGHGRISLPRRQEHRSSRCRRARRGLGGAVELRGRTRQNQCNSFESANCHPPRPRKGEDSYKVWFGFSQSTFGGCLFHRSALLRRISTGYTSGLPGPRSCDKRIIQKKRAPYIPVLKNGALRRIW
jgi:hypothetical protein